MGKEKKPARCKVRMLKTAKVNASHQDGTTRQRWYVTGDTIEFENALCQKLIEDGLAESAEGEKTDGLQPSRKPAPQNNRRKPKQGK